MLDPEWILTTCSAVLGWAALRQVSKTDALIRTVGNVDKRVVAIESKLANGLSGDVSETRADVKRFSEKLYEHMAGEEKRILEAARLLLLAGSKSLGPPGGGGDGA